MKTVMLISFVLSSSFLEAQSVTKLNVGLFDEPLNNYIIENKLNSDVKGALVIKIYHIEGISHSTLFLGDRRALETINDLDSARIEFVVALYESISTVELDPPLHYFYFNNRPVLLYTGLETLVGFDEAEKKQFLKKLKKYLSVLNHKIYLMWRVEFSNNSVKILEKDYHLLPY